MREAAASAYEQVRSELATLRVWEQLDLAESIRQLASAIESRARLQVEVHVRGQPASLSPDTCERLYGLCSEALNNIVKHAHAQHAQVALVWSADNLIISVADDGAGFDATQPPSAGHHGLALMREALEGLEGALKVDSAPGRGTRLQAAIPLRQIEPAWRGHPVARTGHPVKEAGNRTLVLTQPAARDRWPTAAPQ
jgi:signal transduction histidine kinase